MSVRGIAGLGLDLLFPKTCVWCGAVVGFAKNACCQGEAEALRMPRGPLDLAHRHAAAEWLEEAFAPFAYEGVVRDGIRRMKFHGGVEMAEPLAGLLAALFEGAGLADRVDLVVAVPVSEGTLAERGYNQSQLLAAALCKRVALPCKEGVLAKPFETARQSGLGQHRRVANVAGAFAVTKPGLVKGRHILLVDDIITTGATLNECAKLLYGAGAKSVRALCVASTDPDRLKRKQEQQAKEGKENG